MIARDDRSPAAITETFLETNGVQLIMTNDEIVQLFLQMASGTVSGNQIEHILRETVRIAKSQA